LFIQQDLEDEPTKASSTTVAAGLPASTPVAEPTDALSPPPYLMYAVIVLFMMTVPCAFYLCGGARLTLLRRLVQKLRARRYRRVNRDDDAEK